MTEQEINTPLVSKNEWTLKEGVFTVMSVVFSIGIVVALVAMLLVLGRYVLRAL